jgi:hypothetical protein
MKKKKRMKKMDDTKNIDALIAANENKSVIVKEIERNLLLDSTNNLVDEVNTVINNLTLVDKNDIAALQKAQQFLLSTYTDVPQFRPMAVKLTSVLTNGNFPTADSKYWQCKVEAEVHFNELVRAYNKYERALIDIEELDYKIRSLESILNNTKATTEKFDPELIKFDLRRLVVKRKEYLFEVKQLEKTIKYRIEEVTDWHKISEDLKSGLKHDSYDKHLVEAHFKKLQYRVDNAKEPLERQNYEDQLNTFKKILVDAHKKVDEKKENLG